jgi:hypothetical protein
MALTLTAVTHPNTTAWEGDFLGLKARVYDVTFDSSYPTTGEDLTADELGWDQIHGIIPLTQATTSTGTTALIVQGVVNTARDTVALFLYESATAGTPVAEITNGDNVSTFTARMVILGT